MPIRRRGELSRRFPDRRVALPDDAPEGSPLAADEGADEFEALVERALDSLPEEFARLLDDVAIVIEEQPTDEQIRSGVAPPDGWLYGLYEGVPGVEWGADMVPLPNKITLFRLPLEHDFVDPDQLAEEVQRTVIHELAHHAGITDERLHELGYD